jgi:exodeoxyribonuclease-5
VTFSPSQDRALKAVAAWHRDPHARQVFYLAGHAGTGKTHLARHFAENLNGEVCFCAFTGKAALVMRGKGCGGASTIHSLIYRPTDEDGTTRWVLDTESPAANAELIIVDECSMVGPDLGRDLLSYGRKVLVLGDPAQLPPVDGAGFFTDREPDWLLTEIHRQAAESPIIVLANRARQGLRISAGSYGSVRVVGQEALGSGTGSLASRMVAADAVLCGLNRTRVARCAQIRRLRGMPTEVTRGDKLVCLRNNREKGLLNGSLWRVEACWARSPMVCAAVRSLDGLPTPGLAAATPPGPPSRDANCSWPDDDTQTVTVRVNPLFFEGREAELSDRARRWSDEFTFGDALTVHKSQGSQWDSVVLFDESAAFREDGARWLYTGITRAARELTLVLPTGGAGLGGAGLGGR